MYKLSTLILAVTLSMSTIAQQHDRGLASNPSLSQIAIQNPTSGWLQFRQAINPTTVFSQYQDAFGLTSEDEMISSNVSTDELGMTHYRYQQYHNSIPVEGAVYLIHAKDGKAISGNGMIVSKINTSAAPQVSGEVALSNVLQNIGAKSYAWEQSSKEQMLKKIKKNDKATYYPSPKLVYYNSSYTNKASNYLLAWKYEVLCTQPAARWVVYVNANSGDVIKKINILNNTDVPGTANTKYNGVQQIIVDSISATSFRLQETGRGGGIQTFSMLNGTDYNNAVDVTSDTNSWTIDSVAYSAQWGSEKTYDYFLQKHNRDSYDGAGGVLISYVHYDQDYANAFWNGTDMNYGDGDATIGPFTTIDICAHEISHGVTEHSANLVYLDEPGALNESISDIFGTCVEFFADDSPNWIMGEDIDSIRSMSNPKLFKNPNTYKGQYWVSNGTDNGGVHTNSGVLNYWFYLLAHGGTGVNDNGDAYTVQGIGLDSAANITYRMLTVYLTESSQYFDAYLGSLQATEDLYGACSNAVSQAAAAWFAVGIGHPFSNDKMYILGTESPITACGYDYTTISMKVLFNGCDSTLAVGTKLVGAYKLDANSVVLDTLTLSSPYVGGDTMTFSFTSPADVHQLGTHTINFWLKLGDTTQLWNDSLKGYQFQNLLQQNIDMELSEIVIPNTLCMGTAENVGAKMVFHGCDSLAAGTVVHLGYRLNGGTAVIEPCTLINTLRPLDTVAYQFIQTADFSQMVNNKITVFSMFSLDTLPLNDSIKNFTIKTPDVIDHQVKFEIASELNYYIVKTEEFGSVTLGSQAANGSGKGLKMSSGNAQTYMSRIEMPGPGVDIWSINEFLSAKVSFCVDALSYEHVNLKFDLKQTHGGTQYQGQFGGNVSDYQLASNFRVLVNGIQVGGTYNPSSPGTDPYLTHTVNLDTYAGSKFDVTFETRNMSADMMIFTLDNAYLDNVLVSGEYYQGVEENNVVRTNVSPNPATDILKVNYELQNSTTNTISIVDILGNVVSSEEISGVSGMNNHQINVSGLAKGVYVLTIKSKNSTSNYRFIKG